ncbi:helix-turn-helix transcriptional regulator [Deferrisoma camini]|uniref:helix-turn-helix transcriptional regulator n=1 Tax=Deferrisoma camini TaxID=1035120 RepID=UPI00046CAA15|nr:helix-turn-helix domain-containing protein [Deferrisoma camini]
MSEKVKLMNEKEAAAYLGLSVRTLQAWRQKGIGPAWKKLGRAVRYALSDLDAFLEECTRASTSDAGPKVAA